VTSEGLTSLCRIIEQNIPALNDHSQQYFRKFANAAERAITARDFLFKEIMDLFKQNNESNARASSNSTMVGKVKILSYEDIKEAQKKRDENEAAGTGRRERKRKNTATERRKPCAQGIEEASREIQALGMGGYCSVF
jgi:hypothetical protein